MKTWREKLTKAQRDHLSKGNVKTLYDLDSCVNRTDGVPPCPDCVAIAKRLKCQP